MNTTHSLDINIQHCFTYKKLVFKMAIISTIIKLGVALIFLRGQFDTFDEKNRQINSIVKLIQCLNVCTCNSCNIIVYYQSLSDPGCYQLTKKIAIATNNSMSSRDPDTTAVFTKPSPNKHEV